MVQYSKRLPHGISVTVHGKNSSSGCKQGSQGASTELPRREAEDHLRPAQCCAGGVGHGRPSQAPPPVWMGGATADSLAMDTGPCQGEVNAVSCSRHLD